MKQKSAQAQVKNAIAIAYQGKATLKIKKSVSEKGDEHRRFELTLPNVTRTWGAFGTLEACWISFWFGKVLPLIRDQLLEAIRTYTNDTTPKSFVHAIETGTFNPSKGYHGPHADVIHALACALSPLTNGITFPAPPPSVDLHDGGNQGPDSGQSVQGSDRRERRS
jgi:hypothetical protein